MTKCIKCLKMRWAITITINVNLRLNLIPKINISNLHQHIQKQVSLVTTVSRYFCWYAGKSLLGTAAVNVAIICIFNIRRRENSLMKQILDLGEGDFSMAMSKRESKKRNIKNLFSRNIHIALFKSDFFLIENQCTEGWKCLLIFSFLFHRAD